MSRKASTSTDPGVRPGPINFEGLHKKFQDSLRRAFASNNVQILKADYDSFKHNIDSDKKPALDQTFREFLLFDLIRDIDKAGELIRLSVEAAREDMVSITIPVVLLGDAFDAVTLEKCEQMFTFVEDMVAVWKEEVFFTACKNNLLRMCNDLLRRLSRSQNTVFCGRILLFLAKFFPFSERSGLNIVSEFNLDNVTEYGADGKDMGEVLADTVEEIPVEIDYNLYCKFWALQDFFRNPNQCYNKVQWKTFASHASSVLQAFSSFKLEEQRSSSPNKRKIEEPMEVEEEIKKSEHFFAKFLTNPKLLALQLSDSNFRRSVLVQFLILFQYLTSTVKFKADSFNLNSVQSEYIKETEVKVYKLLEETPPHGKKFAKTVQHMLQREELWNNWKNEGCKEFKRPEVVDEGAKSTPKKPKKSLGDLIKDSNRQGKFYLGSNELTRLWNLSPDNLKACKGEDRNFLPPLETYLENSREKTESSREKNDPSFDWRALRLLAKTSPHFFTLFNTPSYKVADYLECVRKKIQKDKAEIKIEIQEESQTAEQVESETVALVEAEDPELLKTDQLTPDDKNAHKTSEVTKEHIEEIAPKIGSDWKKLGKKLGYLSDEIAYFESENPGPHEPCKVMLSNWFDDDDDANLDNLAYILEGLDMHAAADLVKKIIDPPNKMEDISD